MSGRRIIACVFFLWMLLLAAFANAEVRDFTPPPVLTPPIRTFILNPDLSAQTGRPLPPLAPVPATEHGYYLCAEIGTHEILLASPPATQDGAYRRLSISPDGTVSVPTSPDSSRPGFDAFLRLPGDSEIICRQITALDREPLRMGVASRPEGSYVWELYQDALKQWAHSAVQIPSRPPDPPTGVPASLSDRLWFLSLWLHSTGFATGQDSLAEDFLRRAALWEVLRIRPLNDLGFSIQDLSENASGDCMPIPDEESRIFCRVSTPLRNVVTGPAILHVTLRPEVRREPTAVLEEYEMRVMLDGALLRSEPVPTYPDHEPYPEDAWSISPPPLLSHHGDLLGRKSIVRIMVPPGTHEIALELVDHAAWWALTLATPLIHLEDAANCSERLDFLTPGGAKSPLERFILAEEAYLLGKCSELPRLFAAAFGSEPEGDTRIAKIVAFRRNSCSPEGEVVIPQDLAHAFSVLGDPNAPTDFPWEDRSGEEFRRAQIEAARASYYAQAPGGALRNTVSSGAVNLALANAVRQLWFLDSVWLELMPQDADERGETWLFQERAQNPEREALPGGVSLVEVRDEDVIASSRLVRGVTREVMLLTTGKVAATETRVSLNGRPHRLLEEAPVQIHPVLADGPLTVRKAPNQSRSVWVQMYLPDREEIAQAKFVRVWKPDEEGIFFTPPPGGYSGYLLIQLFPPADAAPETVELTVRTGETEHILSARYDGSTEDYPLADHRQLRLAHPLSFSLDAGYIRSPLLLRLAAQNPEGWHVRALVRVPRPAEETVFAADRYSAVAEISPERVRQDAARIRALTLDLDGLPLSLERAERLLDRADLLCRLGYGTLAREDVARAAEFTEGGALLQERLLSLSERVDVGACRRQPPEALAAPIPMGAIVEDTSPPDPDLLDQLRAYQRARIDQDVPTAFAICEHLLSRPSPHFGCLSWWGSVVAGRVASGEVLSPDVLPLLITYLHHAERSRWAGHDRWLPLLLRATHWQSVPSAEQSMGSRLLEQSDPEELQGDNPAYFQVSAALAAHPDDPSTTRLLLPGSTLVSALPTPGPVMVRADVRCSHLGPSLPSVPSACRFTLRLDGLPVSEIVLAEGHAGVLQGHLDLAGSHLVELTHLPGPESQSPVGTALLSVDRPLPGIPVEAHEGRYLLQPVARSSLWVATPARPVGLHILGPAILKIQSFSPAGQPAGVDVRLSDSSGRDIPFYHQDLPGRQDLWLTKAVTAWLSIAPASGSQEALVRVFYRELSTSPLTPAGTLPDDLAVEPGNTPSAERVLDLADTYAVDAPSPWGLGSLLVGFRRQLRDETGRIDPVDHYFLAQAGFTRRIEPLTLWFAADVEGRYRLDGHPSGILSGRMVWLTPDPSLLTLELRDSVAAQEVQTGTAGGNLVSLSLSRRFELSPTWSLTPDLSVYYKWQALNAWREELPPSYMDASVYSPYLRDHPWSPQAALVLGWQPWINTNFFSAIEAAPNSDFRMLDYARFRIGDRMAFGRFQMLAFYDIQTRFSDAHREEFYLRHQLHLDAQFSFWPHPMLRVAPVASYDFYPHNIGHGAFGGILIELSPRRGLRDHAPGEIFPWQIDPHRQWVRQWQ